MLYSFFFTRNFETCILGKFARIAPNHVSIGDPEALQIVYGHGTGTTKVYKRVTKPTALILI